jgi:hypothetical protein
MRPGFADLIVCYFFLVGAVCVARLFASAGDELALTLVALVAAAGCALSKKEGVVWAVWIIAVLGSYGVHIRWAVRWRRILVAEFVVAALLFVAYHVTMGWVRANVEMDRRAALLFVRDFEPGAVTGFLDAALGMASFHLWWWFVVLMFVAIWIRRAPCGGGALTLYVGALLAGLLYFACFTGNAELTVLRTNVGRFLLQLAGVFVPLYALFIRQVVSGPSERAQLSP